MQIKNLPAASTTDSYVTVDAAGNLRAKSTSSPTYAIGDFAQGGVIFWLSPDGRHGKVVSIYNMGVINWSNITSESNGDRAISRTNGAGNTVAITLQPGHTFSAAQHCTEFAYGGYSDWYLPAIDAVSYTHLTLPTTPYV